MDETKQNLIEEIEFQLNKLSYHDSNLTKITHKNEFTTQPFQNLGVPQEADYECDAIFQTAKKIIDTLVKLILLEENQGKTDEELSLQKFFNSIKTNKIGTGKIYNVCSSCQDAYQTTIKSVYEKILKNTALVQFLNSEYQSWIEDLIEKRTNSAHRFVLKTRSANLICIEDDETAVNPRRIISIWNPETYGLASSFVGSTKIFVDTLKNAYHWDIKRIKNVVDFTKTS